MMRVACRRRKTLRWYEGGVVGKMSVAFGAQRWRAVEEDDPADAILVDKYHEIRAYLLTLNPTLPTRVVFHIGFLRQRNSLSLSPINRSSNHSQYTPFAAQISADNPRPIQISRNTLRHKGEEGGIPYVNPPLVSSLRNLSKNTHGWKDPGEMPELVDFRRSAWFIRFPSQFNGVCAREAAPRK